MDVDATADRYNVWWTLIKRDISDSIDLAKLKDPAYELRIEARVRTSHAPRRVNFMINTQRTVDFHEHLREYDLADTSEWHTISMTTKDLDAGPGDKVFVQLGVTDYGLEKYHVDLDYFRADVVRRDAAEPDVGEPLVYHPPIPELQTFAQHLPVTHDSIVHTEFPTVNFNDWHARDASGAASVLTVTSNQWAILRWDFSQTTAKKAAGAGILELTTFSHAQGGNYVRSFGQDLGIEFGKVRVIEILGGDQRWDQTTVTYDTLLHGEKPTETFNAQMISDVEVAETPGGKTFVTLSRPVMQRLLDGTTKGLLIRPLGAVSSSFYAREDATGRGPVLHLTTTEASKK
jgi:hypothetical protein